MSRALRLRRLAEDGEQRRGIGDFGGLLRERAPGGVLLVALLQRPLARALHGPERRRKREDHVTIRVTGHAHAIAAQLARDVMLHVESARRAVGRCGANQLSSGLLAELPVRCPEIIADGIAPAHAENALPRRVDVCDAPIRRDHDDRVSQRLHRGARVEPVRVRHGR